MCGCVCVCVRGVAGELTADPCMRVCARRLRKPTYARTRTQRFTHTHTHAPTHTERAGAQCGGAGCAAVPGGRARADAVDHRRGQDQEGRKPAYVQSVCLRLRLCVGVVSLRVCCCFARGLTLTRTYAHISSVHIQCIRVTPRASSRYALVARETAVVVPVLAVPFAPSC